MDNDKDEVMCYENLLRTTTVNVDFDHVLSEYLRLIFAVKTTDDNNG